jgi:hypothetical protein
MRSLPSLPLAATPQAGKGRGKMAKEKKSKRIFFRITESDYAVLEQRIRKAYNIPGP